jgi:moderate conductance mechanosensitive channel
VWHVRNGEIERLGNESRDWARVLVDVEVARGTDLTLAMRTVEEAAHQVAQDEQWQPFLLEAPELWGVEEVKPTSITIRLAVKTRPSSATTSPASSAPAWSARWSKPASFCRRWPRAS